MTGTPPVLKKVSCNLQDACDGVASVLTFAELLATASQSPKHLQSSLRRRRKRPFFCRVVCDGVASILFFAEFFATPSPMSCFFAELFATASQATLQIAGNYFSPILYF